MWKIRKKNLIPLRSVELKVGLLQSKQGGGGTSYSKQMQAGLPKERGKGHPVEVEKEKGSNKNQSGKKKKKGHDRFWMSAGKKSETET